MLRRSRAGACALARPWTRGTRFTCPAVERDGPRPAVCARSCSLLRRLALAAATVHCLCPRHRQRRPAAARGHEPTTTTTRVENVAVLSYAPLLLLFRKRKRKTIAPATKSYSGVTYYFLRYKISLAFLFLKITNSNFYKY